METPHRQHSGHDDHTSTSPWQAMILALAEELAVVQRRLAEIERELRPSTAPIRPGGTPNLRLLSSSRAATPPPSPLSHRECEVLRLLADGRSNRQIAALLCLSPRTVQRHVANAYRKIGAHNKADATAFALRNGLD